jgi:hypothetical protein
MTTLTLSHDRPVIRTQSSTRSTRGTRRSTHNDGSTGSHGRWVTILEIVAVVAIAIALIAATVISSRPHEQQPLKRTRVFVEKGDTLWSLAQMHPIPGQTTEQTAQLIAELNSMDSSGVSEGMVVTLLQVEEQTPILAQR